MPQYSVNRVVIVGNLTRDPELRSLPSGTSVCHLRVACNARRRGEDGGWEEKPNYFDVSVFGASGENAHRYLSRGRAIAVDGRLEWREWETPEGHRRQAVGVIADAVQFLGAPAGARSDEGSGEDGGDLEAVGAGVDGDDDVAF